MLLILIISIIVFVRHIKNQLNIYNKNLNIMIVAISGASGFIGRKLTEYLESRNINVISLTRDDFKSDALFDKIKRCDCVINLAGENIFKRWTKSHKESILSSRIDTTRQIVKCINRSESPKILISTSAIGYYANDVTCDEYDYTKGSDFLAEVCRRWELEAMKCNDMHRTVITRFAVVLDKDGGALEKVVKSMKFGFATVIGDGKQSFSWIALEDLVRAVEYLILNTECKGVYNLTAPQPTTNLGFIKTLAAKMNLSVTLPIPSFVFKLTMGESCSLLTEGHYILPISLIKIEFRFKYVSIQDYVASL